MADTIWTVGAAEAGIRLDKFLAAAGRLGSRARATAAIERGKVFVNDAEAPPDAGASRLAAGEVVRVWMDRPGSSRASAPTSTGELGIVYEDSDLLVLDKPPGLLSVPLEGRGLASSVYDQVADYLRGRGGRRPFIVHRIDRDTSGLVVFAKDRTSQMRLKDQFRRREPERIYLAIVYGHPDPAEGTWRDYLVWDTKALIQKATHPRDPLAAEAIADYRVLERFDDTSLIEVSLHTGKRNQIRIQARLRGHTLVGERRYVYGPEELRPIAFDRQALHAWRLAFAQPTTGQLRRFEAPLPDDMAALLRRLERSRP